MDFQEQSTIKEKERVIIVSDINSNDEYQCSSCSSMNDSELISLDTRKLWQEVAHIIKCIYRETNREFAENHSSHHTYKVKQYIQILTQVDAESLFNKIEMIALEYVNEIRNQVLTRFQACFQTSNDVQLFISYLLDEYNTFIQAAKNVSTIISSLEEHYMKSFLLTWLLYNKHLYEKLVYMDKNIQLLMTKMIDLLQPTNDVDNDYSPADYTKLLNRFLAFDEEMSEIACLYKKCETKMNSTSKNCLLKKQNHVNIMVRTKTKKICKKTHRNKHAQSFYKDTLNKPTTTIQSSENFSESKTTSQTCPNVLSVSSKDADKQFSCDEFVPEHNTPSSISTANKLDGLNKNDDPHEQLVHEMLNDAVSPMLQIEHKIDILKLNEQKVIDDTNENSKTITNEITQNGTEQACTVISIKTSEFVGCSSSHENENLTASSMDCSSSFSKSSFSSTLNLPSKPLSSLPSKLAVDLRPITIPSLTKTKIPKCPPFLAGKIQSVSFTAGTFGSITANESAHSSSHNKKCSSINLACNPGSTTKLDTLTLASNLNQKSRPIRSTNEDSTVLSSLGQLKTVDELQRSSFNDKNYDYCCCESLSESDSSISNNCVTCMSSLTSATLINNSKQRDVETKERLKIKLTKRTVEKIPEKSKISTENKSKMKQYDDDIDDLVRFIDGTQSLSEEKTSKRNKKKKNKPTTTDPIHTDNDDSKQKIPTVQNPVINTSQTSSKWKTNAKLKFEKDKEEQQHQLSTSGGKQQEEKKQNDKVSNVKSMKSCVEKTSETAAGIETNVDVSSQSLTPPEEEEIAWITISRKQSKHRTSSITAPVSSVASASSSNPIQQKQRRTSTKVKYPNTSVHIEPKVLLETVTSNNKSQKSTKSIQPAVQSPRKSNDLQEKNKKRQAISVWNTHEQVPVTTWSTAAPVVSDSILHSSLVISDKVDNALSFNELPSALYLEPINYSLVQRSFPLLSPAPDLPNTKTSRCIQRPSSSTCNNSLPFYSSMIQTVANSNSSWSNSIALDPNEYEWNYSDIEHRQTSTISSDFPLYDPFNSGASLNILSSRLSSNEFDERLNEFHTLSNNNIDKMN